MAYVYDAAQTLEAVAHAGPSDRLTGICEKVDALGAEIEGLGAVLPEVELQSFDLLLAELAAQIASGLKGVA
jgi:hypothetical protein